MTTPDIGTVRELCQRYSNWGRWGADDELGTLNLCGPQEVAYAAGLVRHGEVVGLSIPLDDTGPQTSGGSGLVRFNPIHLMSLDGGDAVSDISIQDWRPGPNLYSRPADDILILPLQCGTQWDALGHIMMEGKLYNGYSAEYVSSRGAIKLGVANARERLVGRGVLIDLPRAKGVDYLEPGYAITAKDLTDACAQQEVSLRKGDLVLVRTGQMTEVRQRGSWGDYAGGDAPGLGLDCAGLLHDSEIAGVATDTWGMEVRPNQTPDVRQPLHVILIVYMGLWVGEIFDLDPLAEACARRGQYEFLLCAQPLNIPRAVGSPVNPIAIL